MSKTPAVLKPWAPGNSAAYYKVNDLSGMREYFKRHRTVKHFIPTEEAIAARPCTCASCGEPITPQDAHKRTLDELRVPGSAPRGVRGEFSPKLGFILMHYDCAWGVVMNTIARMS
jgi:hypothetical protein